MTFETRSATATLPGPRALPGIGWMGGVARFYRDPLTFLRQMQREHGGVVGICRGNTRYVFLFDWRLLQELMTDTERFHLNSFLMPRKPGTALDRMLTNLLSMNGARHKQQRKLLVPVFNNVGIRAFRDDIVEVAEHWAQERWSVGRQVDLLHEMQELALSVACKSFFGVDATRNAGDVLDVVRPVARYLYSLPALIFPFDVPGTPYGELQRVAERFEGLAREVIARKRASGGEEHQDILSALLRAHDEDGTVLTDAELVGHVTALFVAGHETTAGALAWTMFLLAQHPQVLEPLLAELDAELHGEAPSLEQLKRLGLLERVVKESLRLLPPVPYGARVVAAPAQLGPYSLPQGSSVVWSPFILHREPELYEHPDRFDPDRWLTLRRSPFEYMPFGAGARMCIGAAFALMELKLVLAVLLQRFRLQLVPGHPLQRKARPFLLAEDGIHVRVRALSDRFTPTRVEGNVRDLVELP